MLPPPSCRYLLQDARHGTLVLLDELGKGTEMRMGCAISAALVEEVGVRECQDRHAGWACRGGAKRGAVACKAVTVDQPFMLTRVQAYLLLSHMPLTSQLAGISTSKLAAISTNTTLLRAQLAARRVHGILASHLHLLVPLVRHLPGVSLACMEVEDDTRRGIHTSVLAGAGTARCAGVVGSRYLEAGLTSSQVWKVT